MRLQNTFIDKFVEKKMDMYMSVIILTQNASYISIFTSQKLTGTLLVLKFKGSYWARMKYNIYAIIPNEKKSQKLKAVKYWLIEWITVNQNSMFCAPVDYEHHAMTALFEYRGSLAWLSRKCVAPFFSKISL